MNRLERIEKLEKLVNTQEKIINTLRDRLYLLENPQKFKEGNKVYFIDYEMYDPYYEKCTIIGVMIENYQRCYFIKLEDGYIKKVKECNLTNKSTTK